MTKYSIYRKIGDIFIDNGILVVDNSVFGVIYRDYLIKRFQQDSIDSVNYILINSDATSIRQISEWGMRIIQAHFPT